MLLSAGVFTGIVTSYHAEFGFRVEYDDGDKEDIDLETLLKVSRPMLTLMFGNSLLHPSKSMSMLPASFIREITRNP